MNRAEPPIVVRRASKRYVKYEDTPMLITRVARLHTRTRRSRLWALRYATFDVQDGECLGVIGRNGSGKSTLLRMLAGVTAPTTGLVRVRGRVAPLIAVGVGFHPELTGRENVYVNGAVLGMNRAEIDRRFPDIVEFADVASFIDTPVKFYSSGMFVRLGFSVSILAEPDVLLVDEVLAVGDVAFQMRCFERMHEIRRQGATIVVVSHNLNAVRGLCDRTLVLHDGLVHYDGNTAEGVALYHDLLSEPRALDKQTRSRTDDLEVRRSAEVVSFELLGPNGTPTRHVGYADEVAFVIEVQFTETVVDPIAGFTLFNEAGIQVYSDSTPWASGGTFAAGAKVRFSVNFRPRLATGSYTAQFGLVSKEGTLHVPPHRPLLFYVGGRRRVRGVADLSARFSVTTDEPAAAWEP